MLKIPSRRKLIIILLFASLLIIVVPSSEATSLYDLEPGRYLAQGHTKGCTYFTTNWTVTAGDPVDVFFLTESQYNAWNRSELPASPIYMELGSTGGYYNTSLSESVIYYIVFSNINGSATSSIEVETYFYNCRTMINFPLLIIGVLILACSTSLVTIYYVRKRPSRPEKEPPISQTQFLILWIICALIFHFILGFFLEDFVLELMITFIVFLPIYLVVSFKYFHRPLRLGLSKREGAQCPHHPGEEIVFNCSICEIPICGRCQNFKAEMRDYYRHNWRMGPKLFERTICVDCLFKQLNTIIKILIVLIPVFMGFSVGIYLWSLFLEGVFGTFSLVIGIVMFVLAFPILFIMTLLMKKEKDKIITKFHQYNKINNEDF